MARPTMEIVMTEKSGDFATQVHYEVLVRGCLPDLSSQETQMVADSLFWSGLRTMKQGEQTPAVIEWTKQRRQQWLTIMRTLFDCRPSVAKTLLEGLEES